MSGLDVGERAEQPLGEAGALGDGWGQPRRRAALELGLRGVACRVVFSENCLSLRLQTEVAAAPGWRVYESPAASVASGQPTAAEPLAGLSLGARNGVRFNVSGRSWVGVPTEDYSSSTLYDISATGDTKAGPSFPGSLGRVMSIE